jgi:hypothetical protein
MKRVVPIEGQGKVKDLGAQGLADHPEIGAVDAKVALIQALIPVALDAVAEELQAELTRVAGPKCRRTEGLPGVVRWCRQRPTWRRKLQAAYQKPTHPNESAVKSLDEGFEETLTLHRLGVFPALGVSLKSTNRLESLNALVGQRSDKVDRWRSSDQKQRWLAAALLDIEPRLRRIKGLRLLPLLRQALQAEFRRERRMTGSRAASLHDRETASRSSTNFGIDSSLLLSLSKTWPPVDQNFSPALRIDR